MIDAIRNFLWIHPWFHAAIVIAFPILVGMYFNWRDGRTAEEANRVRCELRDATARIAKLQEERNKLETERNSALAQIAENVKKPISRGANVRSTS